MLGERPLVVLSALIRTELPQDPPAEVDLDTGGCDRVEQAGLEPFVPRVTFTFPCIAQAGRVLVLATGAAKADAVARAFAENALPSRETPASLLAGWAKSLTVLLDVDAASRL